MNSESTATSLIEKVVTSEPDQSIVDQSSVVSRKQIGFITSGRYDGAGGGDAYPSLGYCDASSLVAMQRELAEHIVTIPSMSDIPPLSFRLVLFRSTASNIYRPGYVKVVSSQTM